MLNFQKWYCPKCKHIDKRTLKVCPKCGNEEVDSITRIIGYLKRVSSFNSARQKEESCRAYAHFDKKFNN